jgi:hypothetical protein
MIVSPPGAANLSLPKRDGLSTFSRWRGLALRAFRASGVTDQDDQRRRAGGREEGTSPSPKLAEITTGTGMNSAGPAGPWRSGQSERGASRRPRISGGLRCRVAGIRLLDRAGAATAKASIRERAVLGRPGPTSRDHQPKDEPAPGGTGAAAPAANKPKKAAGRCLPSPPRSGRAGAGVVGGGRRRGLGLLLAAGPGSTAARILPRADPGEKAIGRSGQLPRAPALRCSHCERIEDPRKTDGHRMKIFWHSPSGRQGLVAPRPTPASQSVQVVTGLGLGARS